MVLPGCARTRVMLGTNDKTKQVLAQPGRTFYVKAGTRRIK
jgi:hypothetical protein